MGLKKMYECEYGFRQVRKYDITNALMEPGEKIIAKKINEINENIYCFREYNFDDLSRADFVIYVPNKHLIILEVKDWDSSFVKNLTGKDSGIIIETPFGNKNPYKNQLLKYSRRIEKRFKDALSNNRYRLKKEIPIYSFVIFTKLSFKELKVQGEENKIQPDYIEKFENYTIFSNEVNNFWEVVNLKITKQLMEGRKNEIGLHNIFLKYTESNSEMLEIFMSHNSLSIEKPLDRKQVELAQSIDIIDSNFIFIYGTVGSGKTLILKKRVNIFKLKKQFREISENKKLLIVMKDDHSLLYKEYKEESNQDILLIPLLPKEYDVRIDDLGITTKIYKQIRWDEIDEVLIEEGHTIISNSEKSFEKFKNLITASYLNGNKDRKIIMTLDCNQLQYKEYFRNKVGNIKNGLPNILGLSTNEFQNCELNISYRLSNLASTFSFQYFILFMKSKNLFDNIVQVNSPEGSLDLLKRKEYYDISFCDSGFEAGLKNRIGEVISELKHQSNLILFLDNISHLNFEENNEIQIIDSKDKVDNFNSKKKITITDRPEYLGGLEFENVIIVTTPDTFFLLNYNGDEFYEQLYKNYISLTRSTGEFKFFFFNKGSRNNCSGLEVKNKIDFIQQKSIDLLEYYRGNAI